MPGTGRVYIMLDYIGRQLTEEEEKCISSEDR